MSFVSQNMGVGEEIVFETRLHWLSFTKTIVLSSLSVVMISLYVPSDGKGMAGILAAIVVCAVAVPELITYLTSEFCVTSRRVVSKSGFIHRSTTEILISMMEAVEVRQSVFGRIFGYGTISAVGQGGTKNPISFVAKPLEFRKAVYAQIESSEERRRSA